MEQDLKGSIEQVLKILHSIIQDCDPMSILHHKRFNTNLDRFYEVGLQDIRILRSKIRILTTIHTTYHFFFLFSFLYFLNDYILLFKMNGKNKSQSRQSTSFKMTQEEQDEIVKGLQIALQEIRVTSKWARPQERCNCYRKK